MVCGLNMSTGESCEWTVQTRYSTSCVQCEELLLLVGGGAATAMEDALNAVSAQLPPQMLVLSPAQAMLHVEAAMDWPSPLE